MVCWGVKDQFHEIGSEKKIKERNDKGKKVRKKVIIFLIYSRGTWKSATLRERVISYQYCCWQVVINRILTTAMRFDFFRQIRMSNMNIVIQSFGIKYSVRDLICDVDQPIQARGCDMGQISVHDVSAPSCISSRFLERFFLIIWYSG